jgi:orotate phosphoribosyltransferase
MSAIDQVLRRLLGARDGHFLFESGHHGCLWLDLDAMLWDPAALTFCLGALAETVSDPGVDLVVGPLVGGALIGYRIAERLGIPFTYAEPDGFDTEGLYSARYRLPPAMRSRVKGRRVAIIDDVINAGSAVRAASAAVRAAGGDPVLIAALVRLGETALGHPDLAGMRVHALTTWANALWEPARCPYCACGLPLDKLGFPSG